MNYKEQCKMVDRLKKNKLPLMELNQIEQDFMRNNIRHLSRLVPSGQWHPMHCDKLDKGRVYCLSPDFKLPEPTISDGLDSYTVSKHWLRGEGLAFAVKAANEYHQLKQTVETLRELLSSVDCDEAGGVFIHNNESNGWFEKRNKALKETEGLV